MKRLHFRYEMQLDMSQDVTDHHFLLRLRPMEDGCQGCETIDYRITPADTVDEVWDGFGNRGYSGAVRRSHRRLSAVSEGVVRVNRLKPVYEEAHPMYRFPSAYTVPDKAIGDLCRKAEREAGEVRDDWKIREYRNTWEDWMIRESGDIREAGIAWETRSGNRLSGFPLVISMMDQLYRNFSYEPGITTVQTTAAEALRGGRGVCQDYAHILISMCRFAGIPARYVAGMMVGEGASHAWVEAWVDGSWIGIDPTHNRLVDETYIKLTHGRDFGDGAIDKGCFIGFAAQRQQIHVKVEEAE